MPKTDVRHGYAGIKWRHRISVRLSVVFSLFSVLIFGATLGYNYYQARNMIIATMEIQARDLVMAAAGRVETAVAAVTAVSESMARSLGVFPFNNAQLLDFIKTSVLVHPDVFGSAVAFEPSIDGRFQILMPLIITGREAVLILSILRIILNTQIGTGFRFPANWVKQNGANRILMKAGATF